MTDRELIWNIQKETTLLSTPILDVRSRTEKTETGICGDYVVLHAPSWVTVIPVHGDRFVMVRQWRHGAGYITTEFPGGLAEPGEAPDIGAARELLEETGFRAGKMTVLGSCNPNPALFDNTLTVCLAEELEQTGELHPDDDEVLTYTEIPIADVIDGFCSGEYSNAFLGTALLLYLRHKKEASGE